MCSCRAAKSPSEMAGTQSPSILVILCLILAALMGSARGQDGASPVPADSPILSPDMVRISYLILTTSALVASEALAIFTLVTSSALAARTPVLGSKRSALTQKLPFAGGTPRCERPLGHQGESYMLHWVNSNSGHCSSGESSCYLHLPCRQPHVLGFMDTFVMLMMTYAGPSTRSRCDGSYG